MCFFNLVVLYCNGLGVISKIKICCVKKKWDFSINCSYCEYDELGFWICVLLVVFYFNFDVLELVVCVCWFCCGYESGGVGSW